MSEIERDVSFSIRRLLAECGCPDVTEKAEMQARGLLADQFLKLVKLMPSSRGIHEHQERREHLLVTYEQQGEVAWSFAASIADAYEQIARIAITYPIRPQAAQTFAIGLAKQLAVLCASAWMTATEDLAFLPATEYDGMVSNTYGKAEVESVLISALEPKRRMIAAWILTVSDSSESKAAIEVRVSSRKFLWKKMRDKGLSIPKLAKIMGAEPKSLYDYQKGTTKSLSEQNLKALAVALDIPIDQLRPLQSGDDSINRS